MKTSLDRHTDLGQSKLFRLEHILAQAPPQRTITHLKCLGCEEMVASGEWRSHFDWNPGCAEFYKRGEQA